MTMATHVGEVGQLAGLEVSAAPAGLVLGRDTQEALLPVRLFREEPVRVALIGGRWLCSLVVFRALAVGARVVVSTAVPERWQAVAAAAQGSVDRLSVVVGEQPLDVPAGWTSPALLVDDLGLAGAAQQVALAPWQTRLTLLPRLTTAGLATVGAATLVIAQRLTEAEAGAAAGVLRLAGETVSLLQVMPDDMIALVGGGADRYLWVSATGIEQQYLGPPRRDD